MFECSAMVSTWSRCEVGGEFIRATRLGNKQLPHRIHLCILAHDSSGSLLPPRPSTPPGAIRELRCPSIWLSSIGFRVIGRRIEERGDEEGYWEAPLVSSTLNMYEIMSCFITGSHIWIWKPITFSWDVALWQTIWKWFRFKRHYRI